MKRTNVARALVLLGGAFVFAGCAATVQGGGYAESDPPVVFTSDPTLVEIDAGVWVVRDAERPTYFYDDNYWVYRDGIWFRSPSYDRGWARVEATVVPVTIVQRDHRQYVHFHGAPAAQTRMAPRRNDFQPAHDRPDHHDDGDHKDRGPEHHEAQEHRDQHDGDRHDGDHHDGPDHKADPRPGPPGHDAPGKPDDRHDDHHQAQPGRPPEQRGGPQPGQQNRPQDNKKRDNRDNKEKKH